MHAPHRQPEQRLVFKQIMGHIPYASFRMYVDRYKGDRKVKAFSCWQQYQAMAFAQLAHLDSLRKLETCLRSQDHHLYRMGFTGRVSRNTLANANAVRDYRIYEDLAQSLIRTARKLYLDEDFGLELAHTVYAFDSTTIGLCLSTHPWARYQRTRGAVKLHTQLDLRGSIPSFIHLSEGRMHDVRALDRLFLEPGSIHVLDRAYLDYRRLHRFTQSGAFFVVRTKVNMDFKRQVSHPVDRTTGLLCDQTILLAGTRSRERYPDRLRRIKFRDQERGPVYVFLTNNFALPALTIAQLYKHRWQVELFFKWIKQHLCITAFLGANENAVRTQIWIAVSVYVLVAIIRKRMGCQLPLSTFLQILSANPFDKAPLNQLLENCRSRPERPNPWKQPDLLEKTLGQ